MSSGGSARSRAYAREPSPGDTRDRPAALIRETLRLSGGHIRQVTPYGPVLAPIRDRREPRRETFEFALSPRNRQVVALLTAGWLAALVFFWTWWLDPHHAVNTFGTVVNSTILVYITVFPTFFVVSVNRLRRVRRSVPVPEMSVAFVVTRSPSEPWPVVRSTLQSMLEQDYPFGYDVWLCDERPTDEGSRWCRDHGVRISTRDGVAGYQRSDWPRRTRCKEGNLSYFYDHWGYRYYDVVAQLDCDHVPGPEYLAEIVRPFSDPSVGYVAAPSVCDHNVPRSWAARGRVYREATFHGPFQLGHNYGFCPLCIGSHYAVRTAALAQIGGIGPDLAEDFSTTFLLFAAGWQGAFAIDAMANGAGPVTFAAMELQEFQWARSLTTLLLGLVPANIGRVPWKLRIRFGYALLYYTLLSVTTSVGLLLAPAAAISGQPWVNVSYPVFMACIVAIGAFLLLIVVVLRKRGLLRPANAPVFSWEAWLYTLTRWPYVGLGVAAAVANRIHPRKVTFQVTAKRTAPVEPLSAALMAPFVVIAVVASGAALYGEFFTNTVGYVFLCLLEAATYAAAAVAVPVLHSRQMAAMGGMAVRNALWQTAKWPTVWGVVASAVTLTALACYPHYLARTLF